MNIALIGYGKMGKEIEKIALQRNHSIGLKINKTSAQTFSKKDLESIDVAIEFSTPETVLKNIGICFDAGTPVVVGTTGWYQHFKQIELNCHQKKAALFHATNYSVGVNLFMKVNAYLAQLMNNYPNYEVSMEEIHHIHKLDKPSGTAITLANQIIEKLDQKTGWSITERAPDKLYINDIREGEVPGTHIIKYQSSIDDIEIMHKAHNRQGFALGAVIAAEFLKGKTGIYDMSHVI
ncbi:MAG: 4-hydroxy-tetrahydrodipicolinate reductase [Bacteroidota bacterium]|jgi:4-hydroxy-tetrahydrodipicolinate reductase|nr:4-hydroxy-tetrahydrodipicolinate reductase [Bacteroidota bacterium]MCA6445131.1 4-hydroxy-tetrahydrodipicolinate reductase [Bacteroidota bacterium]